MKLIKPFCMVFFLIALTGATLYAAKPNLMSVQVKNGQVRSHPSFLGKIIETLAYGDRVAVVDARAAWVHIRVLDTATSGWMHKTALTEKKIILSAGDADVEQTATTNELALAGKGFNRQVEGEFKTKNRNIDYHWINKMETFVVEQEEILEFVKAGDLSPRGDLQ